MINMENREEILKKHTKLNKIQLTNPHYTVGGIKNGIKTSGTFVLFEDVPHAMQEYSDQQNKAILDEIELLKFQLKAADSVNDVLEKLRTSDNEAWSKQCAEWMTKHEQIWNECLSANNKIDELEKLLLNK